MRDPQTVPRRSRFAIRTVEEVSDEAVHFLRLLAARRSRSECDSLVRAYLNLADAGLSDKYLVQAFNEIACKPLVTELVYGKRRGEWVIALGFTRKQLRSLVTRLRHLADDLRRINEHSQRLVKFGTKGTRSLNAFEMLAQGIVPGGPDSTSVPADFPSIPDALLHYADALERELVYTGRFRRAAARGKESDAQRKILVMGFVRTVQDVAGKPHWKDIACLLNAVLRSAYSDRVVPFAQDGESLKRFYKDNQQWLPVL